MAGRLKEKTSRYVDEECDFCFASRVSTLDNRVKKVRIFKYDVKSIKDECVCSTAIGCRDPLCQYY